MTTEQAMARLEKLVPNADQAALVVCVEQAMALFQMECARDDVPDQALGVIVRMAQGLYTRIGAEGLSAQTYSGASETFSTDWPDDLRRAIHRFRRARFV